MFPDVRGFYIRVKGPKITKLFVFVFRLFLISKIKKVLKYFRYFLCSVSLILNVNNNTTTSTTTTTTYLLAYLLTYLLHGAESFLRS